MYSKSSLVIVFLLYLIIRDIFLFVTRIRRGERRNFSDLQSEYAKFVVLRMRFRMMAVIIHTAGSLHTYTRAPFICMKQCVQGRVHNVFIYVGSPNVHTKELKYFFSFIWSSPKFRVTHSYDKTNHFLRFFNPLRA